MRKILALAAFLGFLAVLLGAFGAHNLKEKLDPEAFKTFETGVRYMMYHVLAVLFTGSTSLLSERARILIASLFIIGIVFFSGSLFVISTGVVPAKSIWFITPLGGLFFISGWLIMGWNFLKSKS